MNPSRHKLSRWTLAFCLLLSVAISPVLVWAQAGASDTASSATKKSRKKTRKAKAPADEKAVAGDPSSTTKKSKKATDASNVDAASTSASSGNTTSAAEAPKKSKPVVAGSASNPEIAAAQASGKVWVNLDSGIYHKGGRWYGKTKNGKFMTEAEAKAAGYRESQKN